MPSKYTLLAAVAAIVALPNAASARDGLPYIGIEGGVMKPDNLKLDYRLGSVAVDNGIVLEHETGFDADFILGYDFGFLRAEGELGWKRAGIEDVAVSPAVFATTARPAVDGRTRVFSAMANLLLDFGSDDGLQVYGGGGVGAARIDVDSSITGPGAPVGAGINGEDRSLAWQLIAGVRVPLGYNADLGLKYRFFNSKLKLNDANNGAAINDERVDGRFRSHSLLASLIFNLGARPVPIEPVQPAPPPPPPPPPPPATQTCPDGSVILATDPCPLPPPPPPAPEPAPVRG